MAPLNLWRPQGLTKGGRDRVVACAGGLLASHHGGFKDTVPSCQPRVPQSHLKPAGHFTHWLMWVHPAGLPGLTGNLVLAGAVWDMSAALQ